MKNIKYLFIVFLIGFFLSGAVFSECLVHAQNQSAEAREAVTVSHQPMPAGQVKASSKKPFTIPILMYHSIHSAPNRLCVSPCELDAQLDYLKNNGYTTVTMSQVIRALHDEDSLPEKSVAVTFDDGYRDNYIEAFPRLRDRHMVATVFIITRKLNTPNGLTTDQVREMNKYGIEIGSHTQHHVDLRNLNKAQLISEIAQSRINLINTIHCPVVSFCYPSGKYTPLAVDEVKQAGYLGAVTTQPGKVNKDSNLYLMPRIRVNGGESLKYFAASLK